MARSLFHHKLRNLFFFLIFCLSDEELSNHSIPNQTTTDRYQNLSAQASPLLTPNILGAGLGQIAQPYGAEICSYGPVYHPHNILHNYNSVYGSEKTMRGVNLGRGMYGNYHGFYGNNGNLRAGGMHHQNGYDFNHRWGRNNNNNKKKTLPKINSSAKETLFYLYKQQRELLKTIY